MTKWERSALTGQEPWPIGTTEVKTKEETRGKLGPRWPHGPGSDFPLTPLLADFATLPSDPPRWFWVIPRWGHSHAVPVPEDTQCSDLWGSCYKGKQWLRNGQGPRDLHNSSWWLQKVEKGFSSHIQGWSTTKKTAGEFCPRKSGLWAVFLKEANHSGLHISSLHLTKKRKKREIHTRGIFPNFSRSCLLVSLPCSKDFCGGFLVQQIWLCSTCSLILSKA